MSELKVASCFEFEKVLRGKSNKLFYPKSEVDAAIAELKRENERLVKCCKEYDSRQRIDERIKFNGAQQLRKMKRALWLASAEMAHVTTLYWNVYCYQNNCLYFRDFMPENCNPFRDLPKKTAMEWSNLWESIETKCRAKAEKYK